MRRPDRATRDRMSAHASASAIEHHLTAARRELRAQERYVVWLEELLARRCDEMAAGTWPPPVPAEASR